MEKIDECSILCDEELVMMHQINKNLHCIL